MTVTRRSLIGRGALLVASGFLAPAFVTRTALALDGPNPQLGPVALDPAKQKNILIVLQLSGGNDGYQDSNAVYRFTFSDGWQLLEAESVFRVRHGHAMVEYDRRLLLLSGGTGSGLLFNDAYWSPTLPPLPLPLP